MVAHRALQWVRPLARVAHKRPYALPGQGCPGYAWWPMMYGRVTIVEPDAAAGELAVGANSGGGEEL